MTGENRIIPVEFEKAVFGGLFLGRHEGKAILVPHAVPGETAMVRILSEKKDYCTGTIDSIPAESQVRVRSACPHYTICGGCSYLHVPYETELEFKKGILLDSLGRIAGLVGDRVPEPDVISAERFHYRSHASFKVKDGMTGFFRRGTNDIVPIAGTGCLLLNGQLNSWIRSHGPLADDFRVAVDSSNAVVSSFDDTQLVTEREAGFVFARGINQFFQANRPLRGALLERVVTLANCDETATFLDIGCGVGFFTLPLARISNKGYGIDINAESIRYARANATDNGITNIDFQALSSSRLHPGRINPGIIVMDPPRAGIDRNTRKTILAMRPRVIVYVSCNPSTFSRDLKDFSAGGYRLEALTLADMFPCTQHIEVISRITLVP
jgi:23S rRNA (uracil1939-C5)-methyltransferase